MRTVFRLAAIIGFASATARGQAPATGPLILLLPASTRAAGMGDAFAAARDDAAIFYNPAQINTVNGIYGTFARYGSNGTMGTLANSAAIGPLNLGWGVELLEFKDAAGAPYPFTPTDIVHDGSRDALSFAASVGGNFPFRKFKMGVAMKYAEDRVDGLIGSSGVTPPVRKGVLLGDLGISHSLRGGTAALAIQNLGDDSRIPLPIKTTLGYTRSKSTDDFDFAFAGEISEHNRWIGGGGGAEMGYGWIEGWSAAIRAGVHRTENSSQRPASFGATLNADRLALDYAIEFFEHGAYVHHFSIRWR